MFWTLFSWTFSSTLLYIFLQTNNYFTFLIFFLIIQVSIFNILYNTFPFWHLSLFIYLFITSNSLGHKFLDWNKFFTHYYLAYFFKHFLNLAFLGVCPRLSFVCTCVTLNLSFLFLSLNLSLVFCPSCFYFLIIFICLF